MYRIGTQLQQGKMTLKWNCHKENGLHLLTVLKFKESERSLQNGLRFEYFEFHELKNFDGKKLQALEWISL